MNYFDILNSDFFKVTYQKIEEIKKDFPVNHGFVHIYDVVENSLRLADFFSLTEKQKKLLLIASVLHDIGYLDGRENHALNGAKRAEKYLKENSVENGEIKIVCNAIENHGGKKASDYIDEVSMCLVCADKLDFISKRYNVDMLSEEYLCVFPCIIDAMFMEKDNNIVLEIKVNEKFSFSCFESSNYYKKLLSFLEFLSKRLNKIIAIEYTK